MGTLSRPVCNWPLRGAAAIAVGFVLSAPVNAQDAIEEILVTAQKRTESLKDDPIALSHEHKFTMSGEYFLPVSGTLEGFINLNAVYRSDILMGQRVAPIHTYDAHWTLGGAIGLRDERWRATPYGCDLADEPFPIGVLASQFQGQENGGLCVWAAPGVTAREVGVTFSILTSDCRSDLSLLCDGQGVESGPCFVLINDMAVADRRPVVCVDSPGGPNGSFRVFS